MVPTGDKWTRIARILRTRGYLLPDEVPDEVVDELCQIGWLREDDDGVFWPGELAELHSDTARKNEDDEQ